MATLNAICKALSKTITNHVEASGITVYAYEDLSEMSLYPAVLVEPEKSDFSLSFGGTTDQYIMRLFVLSSVGAGASAGQKILKQLLTGWGPYSIRRIIHEHSDLGLPGTTATPMGWNAFGGSFASGTVPAIGAIMQVKVLTDADDFDPYNEG